MTTELEQEFYDTFGIEPRCHNPIVYLSENKKCKGVCQKCENYKYTNITAEKLLQMICILNKEAVYGYSDWGGKFVIGETVEELKESILTDCIRNKSEVFKQIQQLFKD